MAVGEPEPVGRSAPVPENLDDLCDPVVLSHGPAVHQQPVARVCLHGGDLLTGWRSAAVRTGWWSPCPYGARLVRTAKSMTVRARFPLLEGAGEPCAARSA